MKIKWSCTKETSINFRIKQACRNENSITLKIIWAYIKWKINKWIWFAKKSDTWNKSTRFLITSKITSIFPTWWEASYPYLFIVDDLMKGISSKEWYEIQMQTDGGLQRIAGFNTDKYKNVNQFHKKKRWKDFSWCEISNGQRKIKNDIIVEDKSGHISPRLFNTQVSKWASGKTYELSHWVLKQLQVTHYMHTSNESKITVITDIKIHWKGEKLLIKYNPSNTVQEFTSVKDLQLYYLCSNCKGKLILS